MISNPTLFYRAVQDAIKNALELFDEDTKDMVKVAK